MEIRKLRQEEHGRTRRLWEEIFTEDTSQFLDYYYSVKTRENEIYVIEHEGEIVSMIHLNPYQMRIGEQIYQTHYIVAVATDCRYRGQGLMTRLLNHVLGLMTKRGEPFTFLMPASEAIYKPFGFRFVYQQGKCKIKGQQGLKVQNEEEGILFCEASETDCRELAEFANTFLQSYDVVTWRTTEYYRTLLLEQQSENGGILLAKRQGKIIGILCFAREEYLEIREPLFYETNVLSEAVYHLTGNTEEAVTCNGYGESEQKPMIMAKILQPKWEDSLKNAKIFLNEVV